MIYHLDKHKIWFPKPYLAEEDGLLAIGGDLSAERLLLAYNNGIFPWYSDETPILWYSPHERFVLFPEEIRISTSMKQLMKNGKFHITFNKAFSEVISNCSSSSRKDGPGTWITDEMKDAYINLHKLGIAYSVEVWENSELIGGLYGVEIDLTFCGESMFSKVSNASKLALIALCRSKKYNMIDCQLHTPHLESMGGKMINRQHYLEILHPQKFSSPNA